MFEYSIHPTLVGLLVFLWVKCDGVQKTKPIYWKQLLHLANVKYLILCTCQIVYGWCQRDITFEQTKPLKTKLKENVSTFLQIEK